MTSQIASQYLHQEFEAYEGIDRIRQAVEAHYGFLVQDTHHKACLLVLPRNLKDIRPKITEDTQVEAAFSSADLVYAQQVEGAFWTKLHERCLCDPRQMALAVQFMKRRHGHIRRKAGPPFYTHPLIVATKALDYTTDPEVIIAALLHDVVEDTATSPEEVTATFGLRVGSMVRDLSSMRFRGKNYTLQHKSEQADYLNTCQNKGAQLIKLCDRLHNMETLDAMRPDQQRQKAQETLAYFVPVAEKLALFTLVEAFQALCAPYLQGKTTGPAQQA